MLTACSERAGFSASTVSADQKGVSEVRSSTTCWLNPLKLDDLGGEDAASAVLSRVDALVAAFCQVSDNSTGTYTYTLTAALFNVSLCFLLCILFHRFLKTTLRVYKWFGQSTTAFLFCISSDVHLQFFNL